LPPHLYATELVFDVLLEFPNVKAIATIDFTLSFVHYSGGSAKGTIAAISAYPIHFTVP
jgi:hypothetical protein